MKNREIDRRTVMGAAMGALAATAAPAMARNQRVMALRADFLWGVATAAHQVEGNNVNSDCWLLENLPQSIFSQPSGDACTTITCMKPTSP